MKRLLTAALFALSSSVFAATLVPVQLLNPAGSTSGQVIVSTGASTAPGWATVPLSGLSSMAANTVVANATSSSAAPTAFPMPSCSSSNSSLQWSNGTGFACLTGVAQTGNPLSQFAATTSAQLAGVISDETGSGALVFGTSPTINQPTINGVTNGSSAPAGAVGEYPTPGTATGTSLTTVSMANCASVSLTAGEYDVSGSVYFIPAASTTVSGVIAGISTTSASVPVTNVGQATVMNLTFTTGQNQYIPTPTVRIGPLSSTTTVYLVGQATFGASTMTCNGFIRARRVH